MPSLVMTGGLTAIVPATPTVDAGAYADGDALSALMEFNFSERGNNGVLTWLGIRSQTAVAVKSDLHLFNDNPSASTITKNAALTIHANDRAKNFHSIAILAADWVDCEQGGFRISKTLWVPFNLVDFKMRAVLEFDATHTPGSATDFIFQLGAEMNG